MATFRERTKRDGSKSFHVQVRAGNGQQHTQSFPTRRLAERWAKTTEAAIIEGRDFPTADSNRRTVAHAITRYMLEEIPKKKNGRMHKAALPWWSKRIGKMKIARVTSDVIAECRQELTVETFTRANPESKRTSLKEGEKAREFRRTGATVNRYLAVLSHVFTVARKEWRWVSGNPVLNVSKLREGKARDKVLSDDERKRLFEETGKDPTLHAFVVTSLSVACRAGELLKLTWAEVDTEEGQLTFRDTKNESTRSAWLNGEAKTLIKNLEAVDHEPSDPVFKNASNRGQYQYAKLFKAALKRAGITGFTFHGLRHSAATYLARQGATEQQLKAIGGWKSNAVNRYVHLASHDTKAVVAAMNAKMIAPQK